MFADAPRRPVHPVAGRRALGSTETRRVLGGQRQGTASLRLQNLGRSGAYSYFTLQQVFWGGLQYAGNRPVSSDPDFQ